MYECSRELLAYINILLLTLKACWYMVEGFQITKLLAVLSFFTNFTELLVIIYQILQVFVCLKWVQYAKRLQKFQFFVLYLTTIVFLMFCIIYYIDPHSIVSKNHQLPPRILFAFHGGTFILMLFEVLFFSSEIKLRKSIMKIDNIIPSLLYLIIVALNWYNSGKLPYPFLKHIPYGYLVVVGGIILINVGWLIVIRVGKIMIDKYQYNEQKRKRDKIL